MKILKATIRILIILITVILVAGFIATSFLRRAALPEYNGNISLQGLTDSVRVFRDERGVAHIYASNEHDLYFVTGYTTAQERLWQMDLIRRAATGRLAEIFGSGYVETDLFFRSLNMKKKSEEVIQNEDPAILASMQAYAEGVNALLNQLGKHLPVEFRILRYKPEQWCLTDIYNIIGFMGWDLGSSNLENEVRLYKIASEMGAEKAASLIPDWNIVDEVVFPEFELNEYEIDESMSFIASAMKLGELGIFPFSGSNNWAVSGERSETGKPILSNDMHLGLDIPGTWMQIHQVIPGKLDVTGVLIPGEPNIVAGHNERIAWGITNVGVDDIDLYIEKTDSAGNYSFDGEWLPFSERKELIKIKGQGEKEFIIRSNHRGPVISPMRHLPDVALTLRWSGFDHSDEIKAFYMLNRASTWNEFRSAISNCRSISLNINYADVDGNIGLNMAAGIAIRKGAGMIPRDGSTDEFDWKGYVPFDLLPYSFNPSDGFVSSANQRPTCSGYPFYIGGDFDMPYRITRIREMAAEKKILGLDDFRRMVTDNHSAYAALMVPVIIRSAEKLENLNKMEKKSLAALKSWDYSMGAGLAAPSLFEFTRIKLAHNLMADEMGDMYGPMQGKRYDYQIYDMIKEGSDEWVDNINTPAKESIDDLISTSFREAVAELTAKYGKDTVKWEWGRIHTFTLKHPLGSVRILDKIMRLNSKAYKIGGSYHTVEVYAFGSDFNVNFGASERHIFNTADWDKSMTVIPTGTSGIPGSPFYLSQTRTYMENGFYKDPFSRGAVESTAKFRMVYHPSR